MLRKRGEVATDKLVIWIIVVALIVLMLVIYGIYSGKLGAMGEFIKNLLKFGK